MRGVAMAVAELEKRGRGWDCSGLCDCELNASAGGETGWRKRRVSECGCACRSETDSGRWKATEKATEPERLSSSPKLSRAGNTWKAVRLRCAVLVQ